jgi:hypothetical protein
LLVAKLKLSNLIAAFVAFCGVMLGQSWIQLNPSGTPPAITNSASVAYDQPGNHLIVFTQDLVWVLSNANGLGGTPAWTQLFPTGTPPTLVFSGLTVAYDPGSNRLMTFGSLTNSVYILTNANGTGGTPQWIQLSPLGPLPTPRHDNSIVYDAANDRLIIFGGCANVFCVELNDVWVLSNANGLGGTPQWTQLNPSGGPPAARSDLAAAYVPGSNAMIIFGGDLGPTGINDSWVLSNANGLGGPPQWTQLSPGNPPLDRYNMAAGYNTNTNRLVITEGVSNYPSQGGFLDNSTWQLDGANGAGPVAWIQLFPTGTLPSPRDNDEYNAAMDSVNNRLIMFGGDQLNDVWVLILPDPIAQQDGPYQIGYAANLNIGDSVVNLSNDGAQGGFSQGAPGNLCVNVYTFDAQEEEIACCSCLVTPNGLNSLSVRSDLISNTLTTAIPNSIVVKLVSSTPATDTTGSLTVCNPATVAGTAGGMLAWGATLEPAASVGTYGVVNVPFINGTLSASEQGDLSTVCGFIQSQGSNFGICNSCGIGALGGRKK